MFLRGASPKQKVFSLTSVVGAAVVMAGCDDCGLPIQEESGAEIVVGSTAQAGKPFDVAVYGQVGKGQACPTFMRISYKELTTGKTTQERWADTDREINQNVDEKNPASSGKPCRLAPKGRAFTVPTRGTTARKVEISALIEVRESNKIRSSTASKTITVNPAGAQAPRPVPVESGQSPVASFVVDRSPIVRQASDVFVNALPSHDPDGSIVKYEWDLDADGAYDHVGAEQQTTPDQDTSQRISLRVTDNSGRQATQTRDFPVVSSADTVFADPIFGPHNGIVGQTYAVKPIDQITGQNLDSADLDWETDGVVDQTLTTDIDNATFNSRTFTFAGTQVISVRVNKAGKAPATYYFVKSVAPAAAAAASAKATKVTMPFSASRVRVKSRGKVKVVDGGFLVNGLTLTGKARGTVPKTTPKAVRSALRTLAGGRFAAKMGGSATILRRDDVLSTGKGTMLLRSAKSRRTQVCLTVTQPPKGAPGRLKVLGATGRAKGFSATGLTPPALFDGRTGGDRAILSVRKGKARGLNGACRSLSRVLDGKKRKKSGKKG